MADKILTIHQVLQEFVKKGYISTDEYLAIKAMKEKDQIEILCNIADSEIEAGQKVIVSLESYKPKTK